MHIGPYWAIYTDAWCTSLSCGCTASRHNYWYNLWCTATLMSDTQHWAIIIDVNCWYIMHRFDSIEPYWCLMHSIVPDAHHAMSHTDAWYGAKNRHNFDARCILVNQIEPLSHPQPSQPLWERGGEGISTGEQGEGEWSHHNGTDVVWSAGGQLTFITLFVHAQQGQAIGSLVPRHKVWVRD